MLNRLLHEGKNGGKFQRLADADSEETREATVEKFRHAICVLCKDDSRDELIAKFALQFHRLNLANLALEIALGGSFNSTEFTVDSMLEELRTMKEFLRQRAIAGGASRSSKLKALEEATIKMYTEGQWDSVPLAAQEITPKIVALSKKNGPNLLPTTTKPIEWIRAYKKTIKSNPS